jgi:hypothetical protein
MRRLMRLRRRPIRQGASIELPQALPELAEAFVRDGVVCVRGVLDPAELAEAALAIETVLAAPGPLAQVASSPDDPGSFAEDFRRWQQVPQMERLTRESRVPGIAAILRSQTRPRQ